MNWFSNLKIGVRLTACFILVALVAGVIGLVGIKCINDITRLDVQLYEGNTVPLGQIGRVAEDFEKVRVNLREIILDKNYSSKTNYASAVRDISRQIDEELAAFEKTLTTDEGRREFSNLKSALSRFAPIREQIVALAMAGREDEAYALAKSAGPAEVVKEIEGSINKLVDLKVAQAKERSGQNASAGQKTARLVIVVLLAGMALAVGLGLFLSRAISRPLGRLAEAAVKMSRGELDIEVDDGTEDEIGQLAGSFKEMAEKIGALVNDADMLAQAASEGRLDVRADAGRHQGEYRKVIEGINRTLEAVIGPIDEAAACLKEMAEGNLNVRVKGDYRGDHAIIKNALNTTLDVLNKVIKEEALYCLKEMAAGNLDVAVSGDYRGDYAIIKDALNKTVDDLNEIMAQVAVAIEQVNNGAQQVSDSSQALSQGAAESASSMDQVTSSMQQINAQVKQNAENAVQANQLAAQAR